MSTSTSIEDLYRSQFTGVLDQQISVAYIGPALEAGEMDAMVLAESLRGLARMTKRVGHLLYGADEDYALCVRGSFEQGSFIAHLQIVSDLLQALDSHTLERILAIMNLCGYSLRDAGRTLWAIFKKKHGQEVSDEDDLLDVLPPDSTISKADLINVFNDPEVRAAILSALRPLREDGYQQIETRENGQPVEVMTKGDLFAADVAEEAAVTIEERKDLGIEKVAFREDLAWHFSDDGRRFDAQITDRGLWVRVSEGERFAAGDRMHVVLRTTAHRDSNGKLKQTKTIPEVISVDHLGQRQGSLFADLDQHPPS